VRREEKRRVVRREEERRRWRCAGTLGSDSMRDVIMEATVAFAKG
jgi:hypothetical protein